MVAERGPIEKRDIAKGYEYEKDRYVILDDDLKRIKLDTTKTIDLTTFIDERALDPLYLDKPYYLAPDGAIANDAFRVIREALKVEKKVALGPIALAGKERLAAISVRDRACY